MATYQKITSLLFKPQGVHNAAVDYSVMDVVTSPDKSRVYFAVQNVPAGIALTNEEYWQLQIDLSSSKSAMDEVLASFGSYAKEIGTRVKGETAKASGNPVTCLADAGSLLQSVTVLEPQQEGSGDPYPAGGGKNLLPIPPESATMAGITFTVNDDYSVHVKGTATALVTWGYYEWNDLLMKANTEYVLSGSPADAPSEAYVAIVNGAAARQGAETKFSYAKDTLVNVRIVVNSGVTVDAVFYPMIRLASDADPSYAPPSNIRPFIGYDKLDLSVAGKNLFDFKKPRSNTSGITYKVDGDTVRVYTSSEGTWRGVNYDYVTLKAGVKYTFSVDVIAYTSGYMYYGPRRRSNNVFMAACTATKAGHYTSTVTPSEDVEAYMALLVTNDTVTTGDITFANAQIAIGSETTYAPYHNNLHTVQIGQTVYGGKMDWLMGKLVATHRKFAINNEADILRFAYTVGSSGMPYFNIYFNGDTVNNAKALSNAYTWIPQSTASSSGKFRTYNDAVTIYDTAFTSEEQALQRLKDMDFEVVCQLATPIEIQLTPHIISAADPEQTNTLYGDGRIDVEYVKPLHVSIEERVAAALAAAMNTEGV